MTGKELFDLMEEIATAVLGEREKWDDLDSDMKEIMDKSAAKLALVHPLAHPHHGQCASDCEK